MLKALSIFSGTVAGLGAVGGTYVLNQVMSNEEEYKDLLRKDFAEEPTKSELNDKYWEDLTTLANALTKSTLFWGGISAALAVVNRITK